MDMKEIKHSSQILAAGYDITTRILQIRFTSGAEYQYSGVPPELYEKLLAAESAGSFLHKHIKGKYPFAKTKDATPKGE